MVVYNLVEYQEELKQHLVFTLEHYKEGEDDKVLTYLFKKIRVIGEMIEKMSKKPTGLTD